MKLKRKIRQKVFSLDLTCVNKIRVKRWLKECLNLDIDYLNPANDIRVKASWLNACDKNPLRALCTDKYSVRDYVKSKGMADLLIPLLGVYNSSDSINFDILPNSFVLKCNHGSGMNIIVSNKETLDIELTKQQLKDWMSFDFSSRFNELHYHRIKRKIVCEKLISSKAPTEFQFWCVNGEPESILVCRKNYDNSYDAFSYSTEWVQLFDRIDEKENKELPTPKNLNRMIEYAKKLSLDFPFVRVDFYEVGEQVFFAELTFTPDANRFHSYNEKFIRRLGEKLKIE